MPGPLTDVDTQVAAINLDVQRSLRMTPGVTLEFLIPDNTQPDDWAVIKTITKGFNKPILKNEDRGDGKSVRFDIADLDGDLAGILRNENLHIRCEGIVYPVGRGPQPQSEAAQVFVIICATRTLNKTFFDNRR